MDESTRDTDFLPEISESLKLDERQIQVHHKILHIISKFNLKN